MPIQMRALLAQDFKSGVGDIALKRYGSFHSPVSCVTTLNMARDSQLVS